LSSPDFGLAWLCKARALDFGLSGFKPSQAHPQSLSTSPASIPSAGPHGDMH
jgi:hypothetical protein